jgi:hypothetical protein
MIQVYVKWDTDGLSLEECGLKNIVEVPGDMELDDIADYLSDKYGFLVESLWVYSK